MTAIDKTEFWQELEATDEDFIKRKLALGGYSPLKKKVVIEWLSLQNEKRQKEREALALQVTKQATKWNCFTALASCVTAIVAIATLVWSK